VFFLQTVECNVMRCTHDTMASRILSADKKHTQ